MLPKCTSKYIVCSFGTRFLILATFHGLKCITWSHVTHPAPAYRGKRLSCSYAKLALPSCSRSLSTDAVLHRQNSL